MLYFFVLWTFKYSIGWPRLLQSDVYPSPLPLAFFGPNSACFYGLGHFTGRKILFFLDHSGMTHAISVKRNEGRCQKQNCLFYLRFSCTVADIENKRNWKSRSIKKCEEWDKTAQIEKKVRTNFAKKMRIRLQPGLSNGRSNLSLLCKGSPPPTIWATINNKWVILGIKSRTCKSVLNLFIWHNWMQGSPGWLWRLLHAYLWGGEERIQGEYKDTIYYIL